MSTVSRQHVFLITTLLGCRLLPAWMVGDPHICTLDGFRYTFNGLGEFTLLTTKGMDFTLQVRLTLVSSLTVLLVIFSVLLFIIFSYLLVIISLFFSFAFPFIFYVLLFVLKRHRYPQWGSSDSVLPFNSSTEKENR